MLKLTNLTKKFGNFTAVNNINLEINAGDFFGFLGQNGAGKTTTIKMITGLFAPTNGSVHIGGYDIQKNHIEAKKLIGYIPDQPFLYDKLTGKEFLFFCGGLYKIEKSKLKNKIDETIDQLKIEQWVNKRTEEYSQGMKQRIAIASALLHNPKLLVVDEPMVGLDPQSALLVKNALRRKASEGVAIFMSTHSLNVAEEVCSRIGIIKDGQMIFEDKKEVVEEIIGTDHQNLESLFLHMTK
ncbi:MAG: ABC transporter ATP-binding protein [Ignavibacteriaceae bacterium]|jgi:ABC-2 type transport system ATP-binding protein|nr:ABC transporter ATP-binding protein [Ignavibacteriaceae bacterium]MCU0364264.1 ABC transporter ATP-binding protein [Ignavibacteriaceae bacterium]MCU0405584.1 ABC transporter ATP-binding protein [Ignavibacteriaceae bacterium]MCU0413451.1 ABC transporter ATP-binding protein [Ignavibacteriaceae bacterium]